MPTSRDLKNRGSVAVALTAISVTSNTTRNGSWIDASTLASLTFIYSGGSVTDGTYTFSLSESDDQTTVTAVASDRTIGSLTVLTAGNLINSVGVHPTKRYVRINMVSTSTSTGAHAIGAIAVSQTS